MWPAFISADWLQIVFAFLSRKWKPISPFLPEKTQAFAKGPCGTRLEPEHVQNQFFWVLDSFPESSLSCTEVGALSPGPGLGGLRHTICNPFWISKPCSTPGSQALIRTGCFPMWANETWGDLDWRFWKEASTFFHGNFFLSKKQLAFSLLRGNEGAIQLWAPLAINTERES